MVRLCLAFLCVCTGWVAAQDSIRTVVAEQGDGIFSLLRKEGIPPQLYKDFVELNQSLLGDSLHLTQGQTYTLPRVVLDTLPKETIANPPEEVVASVPEVDDHSIYGKGQAAWPKKSDALKKAVYYLVSGHGGPDPGAMGKLGKKDVAEDEYAYDVTLRLARELESHGATVYMIIEDPNDGIRDERYLPIDRDEVTLEGKAIPLKQIDRLKQRVKAVNKLYKKHRGQYQRLIVTHIDSRSKGQNIDVFFYHHHKSKNGKHLSECIHKTFEKKYKKFQPNRTYTGTFSDRSSLYLVKNTLPAMTFIELGNIRNKKDQRRILDPDNRQALAKWISEGVLLDYNSRNKGMAK